MKVTHVLDTGLSAVELEPGIVVVDRGFVTTIASLNSHGVILAAVDAAAETLDVPEDSLQRARQLAESYRRFNQRVAEYDSKDHH